MIIRVGRKDRTVPLGLAKNGAVRVIAEAALVIKISVPFNMHRNLYSWTEHGDARFATASLSDQNADALQKTSGYRMAHSSRCCGALLAC